MSSIFELFSLQEKTAVVIGGTGELCGAVAEGFASAGAEVVLVGRDAAKAEKRLDAIHSAGGRGYFVAADASHKADLQLLLDQVIERSGGCCILAGQPNFLPRLGDARGDRITFSYVTGHHPVRNPIGGRLINRIRFPIISVVTIPGIGMESP